MTEASFRLADLHRRAQGQLAAGVSSDLAKVFPLLNPADLDGSFPRYAAAASSTINARRSVSSALAASYHKAAAGAAGVDPGDVFLASRAPAAQLTSSLAVTGPVTAKRALAAGATPSQAMSRSFAATSRAAKRHVLNGGRTTNLELARRTGSAWARVSDGTPCSFCAMLVSRGPVYAEATVSFDAHDGCGCMPMEVFGDPTDRSLWTPDARAYRELWEVSGAKYSGASARAEFRRAYEGKLAEGGFGLPGAADEVVETVAEVAAVEELTSSDDWRQAWQGARDELPEDSATLFRRPATAAEAAQVERAEERLGELIAARREAQERFDRIKDSTDPADAVEQLRAARALGDAKVALNTFGREVAGLEDKIAKGFVDVAADGGPGALAQSQLASIMRAGEILGDELDARIAKRLEDYAQSDVAEELLEEIKGAEAALAKVFDEKAVFDERMQLRILNRWHADGAIDEPLLANLSDDLWPVFRREVDQAKRLDPEAKRLYFAEEKARRQLRAAQAKIDEGGTPKLGSLQWNAIHREETLKLLSELREHGGKAPVWTNPKTGKPITRGVLKDAMEDASQVYPTSWLEAVRKSFPEISVGKTTRGYNRGGSEIKLSKGHVQRTGGSDYEDVAIHEFGHSMEFAVPGLRESEWAYHFTRTSRVLEDGTREQAPLRSLYGGQKELYRPTADGGADWRLAYTGKDYAVQRGVPGYETNHEVFTTGIESLYGGSPYLYARSARDLAQATDVVVDKSFRSYLLGVLSVL